MKEQELYKKFNNYFREALDLCSKESEEGKKVPYYIEEEPEFKIKHEGSGRSIEHRFLQKRKKDYFRFISRRWDLLKGLQSYSSCLRYLKDKNYMEDSIDEQGFLLNPIARFAKETDGFRFVQSKIDEIYQEIENFIFSVLIKFSCSARIFGFESDAVEINIDEFAKIKKYSEDECKEIWKRDFFLGSSMFIINPTDYRLEVAFNKKKEDLRRSAGEGQQELKKALLLLRLFKSSTLRIGVIETKPIQWVPFGGIESTGMRDLPGGNYKLSSSEVPELLKLWENIKNINFSHIPSLEIAIKRFHFAHERRDVEDRLIDLMIAYETLYSTDNKELRYKCSLRTAILIGEDVNERKNIFKIMQVAYDKRSKLIHTGRLDQHAKIPKPVNKEFKIHEFINCIQEYLARSIKKFAFCSEKFTHEKMLERIHESTLERGLS